MGKLIEFVIRTDNASGIYYSGQTITGHVSIVLEKQTEIRNVTISFSGKAFCEWDKGLGKTYQTYSGTEIITNNEIILYGGKTGRVVLTGGNHVYRFSIPLPEVLPSSLETDTGFIRYVLTARICKPWKSSFTTKLPVTIYESVDVHLLHSQPVQGSVAQAVGCWWCCCWKSTVIEVSATINKQCFHPEETIIVNVVVDNRTNTDISSVEARLIQTYKYRCSGKYSTKTDRMEIVTISGPSVARGCRYEWTNQVLAIPVVQPSVTCSEIISLEYEVQIEAIVPFCSEGILKLPITVVKTPLLITSE